MIIRRKGLNIMRKKDLLIGFLVFIVMYSVNITAQWNKSLVHSSDITSSGHYYSDIYSDTWVGTDALGRQLPTYKEVGPVKKDHPRLVGIFYITWHTDNKFNLPSPYRADVTKILAADPNARLNGKNPVWGPYKSYHWGEPEKIGRAHV